MAIKAAAKTLNKELRYIKRPSAIVRSYNKDATPDELKKLLYYYTIILLYYYTIILLNVRPLGLLGLVAKTNVGDTTPPPRNL